MSTAAEAIEAERAPAVRAPVLAIRDLAVTFPGAVKALRGVTLDIAPGEIVGLVGESGSGKSVLGLAALGLLPPAATITGSVLLDGRQMVGTSDEERRLARRRYAGAVFQDPMTSLNPTMKVGRQVAEAAGSTEAAIEALERARVPEPRRRAGQYPHELSGGLRQRVMIAMAIAGSPDLVVADEPTTALDVTVQAEILALLTTIRDETGSSILFVTHDLAVAAELADRIAVLYGGRLAEIGPAADVLHRPCHPYTVALMAARLRGDSPRATMLPTLEGEPPDPRALPPGCPFAPRCPLAEPACDAALPEPEAAPTHDGLVACLHAGESAGARLRVREAPSPRGDPEGAATLDVGVPLGQKRGPTGATPHPGPALLLTDITKAFGKGDRRRAVVDGLSLEVPAGGSLALVGESGCGKTTTLRMAVGLENPDGGEIHVGPGGSPQLVFQDAGASLTPWLTVGEMLEERLRTDGLDAPARRTRSVEVLQMVGLPADVATRRPRQLSGGQRQRVALARAVAVPPALLACDEPISALDVSLAATVLNLLMNLRAELGMAMLFVTHDLAAARFIGDRVAVMAGGRIIEEGPSEDILTNPQHPHTAALVGAIPRFEAHA
ncbi:MAG: oligopeptide/dipeptide transporter, ATP-binding protein [Actinobacteria bacterium]|nr:oligopeptide/dipeptide transporter, ATP-binding protein [Actinomycetota bacterium]